MTILEHIKKEYRNVMEKPAKERLEYFWEYYKWYAIVTVLVIVAIVQGIVGVITSKETVFSGIMINAKIAVADEAFLQDFYQRNGIDPKTQEAAIFTDITMTDDPSDHNTTTFQRIMAGISVQETDFIVGPPEPFKFCAYNSNRLFKDLREYLDEETLEKLEGKIYYVDGAILDMLNAPVGTNININSLKYPDPKKPELMEKPIPVAIDVSDRTVLQDAYYRNEPVLYLGMVANTPRPTLVIDLIKYLFP